MECKTHLVFLLVKMGRKYLRKLTHTPRLSLSLIGFVIFLGLSTTDLLASGPQDGKRIETIKVCDDSGLWPPYLYIKDGKVTGITVDLLDEIGPAMGVEFRIDLINWADCQRLVKDYDSRFGNGYVAALNGSKSKKRAAKYILSEPIYTTQTGVFYNSRRYPKGVQVRSKLDLKRFSVCSIEGYNYDLYDLDEGTFIEADNIETALNLIAAGRCDITPLSIGPVYGGQAIGKYRIPRVINAQIIPDHKINTFHVMFSRGYDKSVRLVISFNKALRTLRSNGTHKKITEKYIRPR